MNHDSISQTSHIRNLKELIMRAKEERNRIFSGFFSPEELFSSLPVLKSSRIYFASYGGYRYAQRRMILLDGLAEPYSYEGLTPWNIIRKAEATDKSSFPIIGISVKNESGRTRADRIKESLISGAFEENDIGDTLQGRDEVFLYIRIDSYKPSIISAPSHLKRAMDPAERRLQDVRNTVTGHPATTVESFDHLSFEPISPGSEEVTHLPSLRVDALVAKAFRLSRTEASFASSEMMVLLNSLPVGKKSQEFEPGDYITLETEGTIEITSYTERTKKGKFIVCFRRLSVRTTHTPLSP